MNRRGSAARPGGRYEIKIFLSWSDGLRLNSGHGNIRMSVCCDLVSDGDNFIMTSHKKLLRLKFEIRFKTRPCFSSTFPNSEYFLATARSMR